MHWPSQWDAQVRWPSHPTKNGCYTSSLLLEVQHSSGLHQMQWRGQVKDKEYERVERKGRKVLRKAGYTDREIDLIVLYYSAGYATRCLQEMGLL